MPVLLNGFSEEGLSPFPGQDSLEKFSQALTRNPDNGGPWGTLFKKSQNLLEWKDGTVIVGLG